MVQPLLDLYGNNPEVFIAARAGALRIVVFVLVVTLVPILLFGIVLFVTARFGRSIGDMPTGYCWLWLPSWPYLRCCTRSAGTDGALVLAALVSAGVVVEAKMSWARSWLRILAVVALAAPILFLGFSMPPPWYGSRRPRLIRPSLMVADTSVVIVVFDELPLSSLLTRRARSTPLSSPTSPGSPTGRTGSRTDNPTRSPLPTVCRS